jgi:hypothetical protein
MQEPSSLKRVFLGCVGVLAIGPMASATDVTGQLAFVGIAPCRMIETRGYGWTGQAGPPSLIAGAERTFQITGTAVPGLPAQCGVPDTALAISVNFTVTGFAGQGDIRVFPAGGTLPLASILNYQLENIANATSVPLGPSGGGHNGITVQADGVGTDFIADVNGYYLPQGQGVTSLSGQTGNVTLAGSNGLSVSAGAGTVTVTSDATSANTPLTIVSRDASGNFSAGRITGNVSGNATNFTGSLGGEVTGTQAATVVSNAVSGNTPIAIVRRDGSGNFSAGTVTLAGNLALPNTTPSVGALTMGGTLFLHNFGPGNTFVGASAGNTSMSGGQNVGVGLSALISNTTGNYNSALGYGALAANNTGSFNSAFGDGALRTNTSGVANSAVGFQALYNNTGDGNSAFGHSALLTNTTGAYNAAFGTSALYSNTTGAVNAAFGPSALYSNTTGTFNSAFGNNSLVYNTTGWNNAAFGNTALYYNTTGGSNAAFGFAALYSLTSGGTNIAVGTNAGITLTTGSSNIYVGSDAGAASESSTIRIGTAGTQKAAFMAGISGTTVSGVGVLVSGSGQLGVAASSRRFKDEIADMGRESDVLMKLRPVAFYYKPEYDQTRTRQYGLVAEEVAQVAPQLVVSDQDGSPQTVRYHFVNAMLLNEVQKQRRLSEEQWKQNEEQRTTITRQESKIQDLEARLAKLEAALAAGR